MKNKLHRWLRGHNNPISVWLKYLRIFDDCWDVIIVTSRYCKKHDKEYYGLCSDCLNER